MLQAHNKAAQNSLLPERIWQYIILGCMRAMNKILIPKSINFPVFLTLPINFQMPVS